MTCTGIFDGPSGEKISVKMGVSYQNGQPKVQLWDDGPAGTLSVASAQPVDLALASSWQRSGQRTKRLPPAL